MRIWNENDSGPYDDQYRVKPIGNPSILEFVIDTSLEAKPFADDVGGGQRKERGMI